MITVIQRVIEARVSVKQQPIGSISIGILALIGIEKDDAEKNARRLLDRILSYRIFTDSQGKMNLSLKDIQGGLLIVPQFTLLADTNSGNRPSFSVAASPEKGRKLFEYLQHYARTVYFPVEFGVFGADMQVFLINDGPVTFTLKV